MKVIFGKTTTDAKYMTKPYTTLWSSDCQWKEETSIEQPTIMVETFPDYATCNYIVIPDWNRRYFRTDMHVDNFGILHISGKVDTLSTYASYIRQINTLILRQENIWNPFIQDSQLPVRTERKLQFKKIGNIGNPKGQNIVLTVGGGKHLEE